MDFNDLNLNQEIKTILSNENYKTATKIQEISIKYILNGHDLIGISKTGTGKTLAYTIPILQYILTKNKSNRVLILAPTRELAQQINFIFKKLGKSLGLRTAILIGGEDLKSQAFSLRNHPHVIIGTPGRVVDHILNTKKFNLKKIKFLVIDEADKLLDLDFADEMQKILESTNEKRQILLYSATITEKVRKLANLWLRHPKEINISNAYDTVESLSQKYLFIPLNDKPYILYRLCNEISSRILIFTSSCFMALTLGEMLKGLGLKANCLYGKLSQNKRQKRLDSFKNNELRILVATDVAARGLDIIDVAAVINYDVPQSAKMYVQRVGRTARAGKEGISITMVSQYEIEIFQKIEYFIKLKMDEMVLDEKSVDDEVIKFYNEGFLKAKEEQKERKKKEKQKKLNK
ncbi:putative ATP-dependent RNA helicase T26G10.1 [Dictyocoela muelleri]|nr:putative ATP-dependent RNA helicase T26G10.1 [Dictyocoela muelleri]